MRIVFQATSLETGPKARRAGVVRTVECLMDAIVRKYPEHDYTAIVRPDHDVAEVSAKFPGVKVVQSWHKTRTWELLGRDLEPMLKRADLFIGLTGKVPRIPWVPRCSVIHDLFSLTHPELYTSEDKVIHDRMNAQIAKYADVVFCNSHHTAGTVTEHLGRKESIEVLPFGAPNVGGPEAIEQDAQTWLKEQIPFERYFLTLSTLEPRKNLITLFDAWEKFTESNSDQGLGLVVVGGKGWLFDKIFEKIETLRSKPRIKLLGYVADEYIPHLYRNAEVFVLPSLIEGFGFPVLEAMHHQTLIACSNTGSLPEVGGEVPAYFDPLSADSICAGLTLALERNENRQMWVDLGTAQTKKFGWDLCAERVMTTMLARV